VEISPEELAQRADAVDEQHHEAMRTFRELSGDLHADVARSARRRFLAQAGAGGAALTIGSALLPAGRLLASAGAQAAGDQDIAAFAQSVELAAVAAYDAAAPVLTDATKPVALKFQGHHKDHASAFGQLAGSKATNKANSALVAALTPTLQGITDEKGALTFAFGLENQAAETYAFALTVLTTADIFKQMASILPIEAEHAAVLGAALGMTPDAIFINGAFENASVGDGTDIKKGIDPGMFPVG
jgi:rubrerythrin